MFVYSVDHLLCVRHFYFGLCVDLNDVLCLKQFDWNLGCDVQWNCSCQSYQGWALLLEDLCQLHGCFASFASDWRLNGSSQVL